MQRSLRHSRTAFPLKPPMSPDDGLYEDWNQPLLPAALRDGTRLLVVAAEIYPLAKTGGLADMVAALPKALAARGLDVRLLMPAYNGVLDRVVAPHCVAELGEFVGGLPLRLFSGRMPDSLLPVWLLDCPALYRREGSLYLDPDGRDWPDNARRFAALCHAAARIALGQTGLDWQPQVVHCNDWHTGLVPLLLRSQPQRPASVFTVHNACFQGNFPFAQAAELGLEASLLQRCDIEFYGQLSLLKAGIRYADTVTTVSPTYARELCTPEFGAGLDGLLQQRAAVGELAGILNGIDTELWNPRRDPHLARCYAEPHCGGKRACKGDLQRRLGLVEDPDAPLAIFISRLTGQKMADVLLEALPEMMQRMPGLQFALLGRGERKLEEGFAAAAAGFPGRAAAIIDYTEPLAHQLHAAGDILLHGSRFEPCGLTQLYAMRYGTVPIVSRVGGLADSVIDVDAQGRTPATGFVFDVPGRDGLMKAFDRCMSAYAGAREHWHRLQFNGMSCDFSWERAAGEYARLFGAMLAGEKEAVAAA
jgi:starch synthase